MRTKILLLGAAALAAGLATSVAQSNVYSVNIAGYVNATVPPNQFVLLANPLTDGTNRLTTLLPTAPNGSQVQVWTGAGYVGASKSFGNWSTNLQILPGQGFFLKTPLAAATFTNTFVGNVLIDAGQTNSVGLPGGLFSLVGSPVPYQGNLTDTNLNLGQSLPNGSQIQVWTGSGYIGSSKSFGNWSSNLFLIPGQGFFVKPSSAATWTQRLPAN